MKRRGFLQMIGAAIAAPALPVSAAGQPGRVMARAITHARTYPCVSAVGLSRGLSVPMAQAQDLLRDLSRRGLVGPVSSAGTGPIYAASEVYRPAVDAAVRVAQVKRAAPSQRQGLSSAARPAPTDWLERLHEICVDTGRTLTPRAQGWVA